MAETPDPISQVQEQLRDAGYLADAATGTVVHLATALGKPVLIEGPAGTGKTQLAKSVALMTGKPLIRLQCYEGLDESKAIYEWDYRRQLLQLQLIESSARREPRRPRASSARSTCSAARCWRRSGPNSRSCC